MPQVVHVNQGTLVHRTSSLPWSPSWPLLTTVPLRSEPRSKQATPTKTQTKEIEQLGFEPVVSNIKFMAWGSWDKLAGHWFWAMPDTWSQGCTLLPCSRLIYRPPPHSSLPEILWLAQKTGKHLHPMSHVLWHHNTTEVPCHWYLASGHCRQLPECVPMVFPWKS